MKWIRRYTNSRHKGVDCTFFSSSLSRRLASGLLSSLCTASSVITELVSILPFHFLIFVVVFLITGQEHNFQKTHPSEEMIFTKYDYESIMHYGEFAFSKRPGVYKTMEAKHSKHLFEPYDKPGLNENDIEMVKKLYKCE